MPGFCATNISQPRVDNFYNDRCIKESTSFGEFYCARNTLDRFLDDKAFFSNEKYFIILEGVILNKAELYVSWNTDDITALAIKMYEEKGDCFFDDFRGSFSGAFYDKPREKWIFFTNHYGDNALFYYFDKCGRFCFGSQPDYVLEVIKSAGIDTTINEHAVYSMLTYAFMIDDSFYANEIKRLLPGHFAVVQDGRLIIEEYCAPKQNRLDLSGWSDDEIIDAMDALFRQAIRREFDKDVEYGFRHLCDLSGGLDSRMTAWVARDMGYGPCLNLTYCQSGYVDEVVAEQIADALGNELLFKPLDDANFLYDAERIVKMNFGLALYSGITGGESLLRIVNMSEFGLEHTGQLGDVTPGTFISDMSLKNKIEHDGMYSSKLLNKMPLPQAKKYIDREQYLFETRAYLGALSTHFIRRNYTEVTSPFLDVDFADFCLSIPIERRMNHAIYKKWILSKYPEAAVFVWEKEGLPLNASSSEIAKHNFLGKVNAVKGLIIKRKADGKDSMNPFDYWAATKPELAQWIDRQAYDLLEEEIIGDIAGDISIFLNKATFFEKTQAITVLAATKLFLS